jgi:hypothetical protein
MAKGAIAIHGVNGRAEKLCAGSGVDRPSAAA